MGTHPIGVAREWPCVGPVGGEMRSCGAEGRYSLVTLAPAFSVGTDDSDRPVVVHLTVCREHLRAARVYLKSLGIGDPVDTYATEGLMAHWGQFKAEVAPTPIVQLQRAG